MLAIFGFSRPMEKIAWDGPKWGREGLVPANPDLADILGDTDFDFENFIIFFGGGSQISGLGPAWAQLGPGLGPATWARLGPTHLGPAGAPRVFPNCGMTALS